MSAGATNPSVRLENLKGGASGDRDGSVPSEDERKLFVGEFIN
jgi:hypothetical protein